MGALGGLKRRLQLPTNLDDLGSPDKGGGVPTPPEGYDWVTFNGNYVTFNGQMVYARAS